MAAAVYTTDLVDIVDDMASSTGWTLISSGGGGASSFSVPETDDYIQGVNCISRNPWTSASIRGMVYSSAQTVAAGDAIFVWWKADVAQALDTKANGGIQVCVGSSSTALKLYYAEGSDTYAFGGWKCTPIDPLTTQSASLGSPSATTNTFGVRWNVPVSGPSKGFPYKIDAIRRGRTLQLVSGDLANGYATFAAVATFGGAITRQWGLFQSSNGVYLQQGLFLMGTAATAVDFRDSNRVLFVAATDFVNANFNAFEVRNVNSRVDWTAVSIQALGTVSAGKFFATDDATINFDGCTFTDLTTFDFKPKSTITGTIFRRCEIVRTGGGIISDCLFTRSTATAAIQCNTTAELAKVTNSDFVSAGTGHAIYLQGPAGPVSLVGLTFTGYASVDGLTGNEAIFVGISTGTVTLTVSGGNTPSIRSSGATVIVVSGATVTFSGFPTGTDVVILTAGTTTVLDSVDQQVGTSYAWAYQGTPTVDVGFIKPGYIPFYIRGLALGSTNSTIPVKLQLDRNYIV